jgi:hypothetical protein
MESAYRFVCLHIMLVPVWYSTIRRFQWTGLMVADAVLLDDLILLIFSK